MDFIVVQQAKHAFEIDKLLESHHEAERRFERDEHRLDRDERILKLMIRAGARARREMREHDKRFQKEINTLREFQAHSDRRLDALIDIVRADRNGRTS